MANLPTPKVIETTIASQLVYHFEVDVAAMKIKVSAFDRDAEGAMIPNTARSADWQDMLTEGGAPNLPQSEWANFAAAMPLVTQLAVAFAKQAGIVDADAEVVL